MGTTLAEAATFVDLPGQILRKSLRTPVVDALALALFLAALYVAWQLAEVWLLAFGGLLLAVVFRGLGNWLASKTGLSASMATGAVWVLAGVMLAAGTWTFGPALATGFDQLFEQMPQSLSKFREGLSRYPRLEAMFQSLSDSENLTSMGKGLLNQVGQVMSTVFGAFSSLTAASAGLLIMATVGLYGSLNPGVYVSGLTAMQPDAHVSTTIHILHKCATGLRWWMVGRLFSMTTVGLLSWVGLWLLGIPAAGTLAVLAAGLSFIPNIGPIVAVIPALLAGLSVSPTATLSVLALYMLVQLVESYLLTPLIQQRLVSMPAALVIIVQLAFGALFGLLGVIFATPVTVVVVILVNELWVKRSKQRQPRASA